MKNIKSTIACILSLLIMTGGMVTAPVSSETAPAFNSVKLDGDVREALENGATTLYILADVNVSAEHYEQLHAHQQATVAFKHSTRDKQDALGDQMFEAQKQLEKGEITQEAYDALCQELQPQIDALDEAYLKELDALDQETKEIALSEYESKLSQWGDEGNILYAGELSSLCRYIIKGELTTEQIINLINDEDVGYIYLPVDLSEWTTPTESTGTDETPPVEVPEESLYEVWEIGIGDVTLTPGKSYTYSGFDNYPSIWVNFHNLFNYRFNR